MKYRRLGRTGFEVSEIGYGAWGIGGTQWLGGSDDESLKALRRAIELGVNLIDTALAYGDGHSEQVVGEVVRATRQWIYVATKVPPKNRLWPARHGVPIREVFPYDYIMRCAEESLGNLKLDAIDLLQLHIWNPEWIDNDDWRRALGELKRSALHPAFASEGCHMSSQHLIVGLSNTVNFSERTPLGRHVRAGNA